MKEGAIDDLINGHTEEGDEQRRKQDRAIVAGPLYLQSLGILTLLTLLPFPAIYHSSIFVACVTMRSLFLRLLSLLRKMSVEHNNSTYHHKSDSEPNSHVGFGFFPIA